MTPKPSRKKEREIRMCTRGVTSAAMTGARTRAGGQPLGPIASKREVHICIYSYVYI